jgi:uncharacterized membrane protein YeaQ/YmgE (transglycosylase-associated protein family)
MEPITWLVIGLIAGWLAGLVMKGSGYGVVPVDERGGVIGTIVVALIGAAVFVSLARLLTRRTVRA